jgi:hypothetical protein
MLPRSVSQKRPKSNAMVEDELVKVMAQFASQRKSFGPGIAARQPD